MSPPIANAQLRGCGDATAGGASCWRSHAFGLEVNSSYEAYGFRQVDEAEVDLPVTRATVVSAVEAQARWDPDVAEHLVNWRLRDGHPVFTVEHHPDLGYRLFAVAQGMHVVSPDGSRIHSAVPDQADWIWQRFLVAHVLPLTAVLNGYEVLHASAVKLCDSAVAFMGGSGAGKTSLALNLVLRQASLMADDVAAIAVRNGEPTVYPGPRLANLRNDQALAMGRRRAQLGDVIGRDEEGLRLVLPGRAQPAPLKALYFLERNPDFSKLHFDELTGSGFASVAAFSFTRYLSTSARMRNQLETLGAIVDRVRLFRLGVPPRMNAAELSRRVEMHMCDELI